MWLYLKAGPMRRWQRLNEVTGWSANLIGRHPGKKGKTAELSPRCVRKQEGIICKPGREPSQNATVLAPRLRFQASRTGRKYFHCLSHPGYSILLWQPELTNTSSVGVCLTFLLMIRLGFRVCGRKTTEVKRRFHSIISGVHTVKRTCTIDINLDHVDEAMFVRLLHSKATFSPFPYFTFGEEVTATHSPVWSYSLPLREQRIWINALEFLCIRNLSLLSHLCIYSLFLSIITF